VTGRLGRSDRALASSANVASRGETRREGARAEPDLPLLAGYWSFGQFWGVWVILVFEYQRQHALTDSRLGLMYSVLSLAAIRDHAGGRPSPATSVAADQRAGIARVPRARIDRVLRAADRRWCSSRSRSSAPATD